MSEFVGKYNLTPIVMTDGAKTTLQTDANGYLKVNNAGGLAFDTNGNQIVKEYASATNEWVYAAAAGGIVNTTTAVTIKAAAGVGIRNYITGIDIMAEALTTATEVAIRDGASGTVIWRTKIATSGLLQGRSIQFLNPLKGTANTLMEVVTLTASGAGAVYVNVTGFVGA